MFCMLCGKRNCKHLRSTKALGFQAIPATLIPTLGGVNMAPQPSKDPKKIEHIDSILDASKLRLTLAEWREVEKMLGQAYEDGKAQH